MYEAERAVSKHIEMRFENVVWPTHKSIGAIDLDKSVFVPLLMLGAPNSGRVQIINILSDKKTSMLKLAAATNELQEKEEQVGVRFIFVTADTHDSPHAVAVRA